MEMPTFTIVETQNENPRLKTQVYYNKNINYLHDISTGEQNSLNA